MFQLWAGNKAAMWGTADPHTGVQIPPRPLNLLLIWGNETVAK